jgi:hypothetical protein
MDSGFAALRRPGMTGKSQRSAGPDDDGAGFAGPFSIPRKKNGAPGGARVLRDGTLGGH